MVSKIAVAALVLIVSCPILLGYAMNLQEVTVSDYKPNNDPVNVTELLQTGTGYTYTHADPYNLNTNFLQNENKILPKYELVTSNKSSLSMNQYIYTDTYSSIGTGLMVVNFVMMQVDYTSGSLTFNIRYIGDDYQFLTVNRVHSVYFNDAEDVYYYSYYNASFTVLYYNSVPISDDLQNQLYFVLTGTYTGSVYVEQNLNTDPSDYVDISSGFRFTGQLGSIDTASCVDLPDNPRNVLFTIDLSTISDSNYNLVFSALDRSLNYCRISKVTDGSGVHWAAYQSLSGTGLKICDLYYDSSRSSNTYQVYIDLTGVEFRYVGDWPTAIGPANYYLSYFGTWHGTVHVDNVQDLYFFNNTPKLRIDDSEYRAFEYPIIENETYTPANFKANPSTTISNTVSYGSSITFAGNTYNVSEGKITIDSHQIPVNNLTFSSVPVAGGYENKIGNTVISTTATPSTIVFNGQWSASVSTESMKQVTYTKTEWTPGQFGWDGIDQNFLMVGMLTAIGVFVGLGIYAKSHNVRIWPVLLVCGGAILLFFCMI